MGRRRRIGLMIVRLGLITLSRGELTVSLIHVLLSEKARYRIHTGTRAVTPAPSTVLTTAATLSLPNVELHPIPMDRTSLPDFDGHLTCRHDSSSIPGTACSEVLCDVSRRVDVRVNVKRTSVVKNLSTTGPPLITAVMASGMSVVSGSLWFETLPCCSTTVASTLFTTALTTTMVMGTPPPHLLIRADLIIMSGWTSVLASLNLGRSVNIHSGAASVYVMSGTFPATTIAMVMSTGPD